jgi:hypothetical protein
MMTVWISLGVAALTFAFGVTGLYLQKLLPAPHTSDRSRDMITAIVGLISLLLALVLGTLIGSAYSFYSTQKSEMNTFAARALRSGACRIWARNGAYAGDDEGYPDEGSQDAVVGRGAWGHAAGP